MWTDWYNVSIMPSSSTMNAKNTGLSTGHLCSCFRDQVLMTPHQIVVVIQMSPVTQVTQETTMRIMILVSRHQVSQTLIECFE